MSKLREIIRLSPNLYEHLKLAHPEFCSKRCPSVWKTGEQPPHHPDCQAMRATLDAIERTAPVNASGLMNEQSK